MLLAFVRTWPHTWLVTVDLATPDLCFATFTYPCMHTMSSLPLLCVKHSSRHDPAVSSSPSAAVTIVIAASLLHTASISIGLSNSRVQLSQHVQLLTAAGGVVAPAHHPACG